ncbi:MAG: hypothetical protein EOP56_05720 [Sphingobacteriales bacterium]|nr:MAG: hypothetical protein EOP56_05720 [Sphingobacteriales bacterium]
MKKKLLVLAALLIGTSKLYAQGPPEMAGWSETSQAAVREMVNKYGAPAETTPTMMVWYNNGPWVKTIVYKDAVPHSFPKEHNDVIQQWVGMKASEGKVDNLYQFDGSVVVERTNGLISVRCHNEAANMLVMNIVNDVMSGTKTVINARDYLTKAMRRLEENGTIDPYMQQLNFKNNASAGDKDKVTITR